MAREQMEMQRQQFDQQMAIQQKQMAEQKAIAEAPPPPPPAEVATAAAPAVEQMAIPTGRTGMGRRRLRTDVAGGTGGLNIPAA